MAEVADLEAKLGHHFTRPALLDQALTHGSVRHEQQTLAEGAPPIEDNERLEFLGDAIVGMIVAELLYRRYPELHEGELTRLRAALVSRKHLGLVGARLELGSYLRLGKAEERNGGRRKAVLLANCMEALIGAVYLEGGLPAATNFVETTIVEPYMEGLRDELRENRAIGDYKTALQELLQARRSGQPEYVVEGESGPDHRKRFLVAVHVGLAGSCETARAEGSTKKTAEQEAARRLYELLRGPSSLHAQPSVKEPSPSANGGLNPADSRPNPAAWKEEHPSDEEMLSGSAGTSSGAGTSGRVAEAERAGQSVDGPGAIPQQRGSEERLERKRPGKKRI